MRDRPLECPRCARDRRPLSAHSSRPRRHRVPESSRDLAVGDTLATGKRVGSACDGEQRNPRGRQGYGRETPPGRLTGGQHAEVVRDRNATSTLNQPVDRTPKTDTERSSPSGRGRAMSATSSTGVAEPTILEQCERGQEFSRQARVPRLARVKRRPVGVHQWSCFMIQAARAS